MRKWLIESFLQEKYENIFTSNIKTIFYISIRNDLHILLEKKLKPNVDPWKKKYF